MKRSRPPDLKSSLNILASHIFAWITGLVADPSLLHFISGDSETTTRLKDICENEFNSSKWLNNRCYYFHNKDEISFDNAMKICSEIFKEIGFGKGRLYEPENLEDFAKIYELADQFSEKLSLPETQKGEFVK